MKKPKIGSVIYVRAIVKHVFGTKKHWSIRAEGPLGETMLIPQEEIVEIEKAQRIETLNQTLDKLLANR